MSRWIELFEGSGRRLSMARLLVFLAYFPLAYVLVNNPTEGMAGIFAGAFVINYLGGKSADIFMGADKLAASGLRPNNSGDNGPIVAGESLAQ